MRRRAGLFSLAALAVAALWVPGAGAQLGPEPPVRHVQGSWVNLRERPRPDARVEAQLPANTQVRLLAEQDGWCEVFYTGDSRLNPDGKGEVIRFIPFQSHMACNLLAAQPLTLAQAAKDPARAFWVAPSPNRLRAYGNALPRPAALQLPALAKTHAEGAEVRYPARPEFDAAKRLLRAGVLLDTAHEIARGKPVPNPVADLQLPGLRMALQPIAPSRFKRHGEVALLHETEADGLAAVAGSRIAVVPTAAPMGRYNRHSGPEIEFVTGFWDVGAADLVFDPPLTIYAVTQRGLVGAQALRKRSWQIDNADFYCGGNYTGPAFEDPGAEGDEVVPVKRYARLPETAQVLTRLVSTNELPASAAAVKAQRHPTGWTLPAAPPEVPKPVRIQTAVVAYEIDLDRDGITDILRFEVPTKGEMSGHPVFAHHWYLNVGGQWFPAGRWIDQECT